MIPRLSALDLQSFYPAHTRDEIVIERVGYSLVYSEVYEQALWVIYELTKEELSGSVPRKDDFSFDPLVSTGSASLEDYRGSGWDRGHIAPAGDMKWSARAMSDSFYLSNISPQDPGLNSGDWSDLEKYARKIANGEGFIIIVSGGILKGKNLGSIGENKVTVPSKFYKIIFRYDGANSKMTGFILPNKKNNLPLESYVVSVDEIERQTGLDFFPEVEDTLEFLLEAKFTALSEWKTSFEYPWQK